MKFEDLRIGPLHRYRLTRDVTNPTPDRRSKTLANVPVWKKGLVLEAVWSYYPDDQRKKVIYALAEPGKFQSSAYCITRHARKSTPAQEAAFQEVLDALEEVPLSYTQRVLAILDEYQLTKGYAPEVLAKLVFETNGGCGEQLLRLACEAVSEETS